MPTHFPLPLTAIPGTQKQVVENQAGELAVTNGSSPSKVKIEVIDHNHLPLHRTRLVLIPLVRAITSNDSKGLRDVKGLLSPVAKLDFDLIGEEEVLAFVNEYLVPELRKYLPKYDKDISSFEAADD